MQIKNTLVFSFFYLISHNRATPRRIQCSGGLFVASQSGVIYVKSVLFGFLYTGHWNGRKIDFRVKSSVKFKVIPDKVQFSDLSSFRLCLSRKCE